MSDRTAGDWLAKAVAGAAGGFGVAIAASGLFAMLTPGALDEPGKLQVVMWIVPPVWIGVMSAVFAFPEGRRAWLWLVAANVVTFALLALVRHVSH